MKTLIPFLIFSTVAFSACNTKDNSFKDARGTDVSAKSGGVQTTGSPRAGESPMEGTVMGSTGLPADATPMPSASPASAQ